MVNKLCYYLEVQPHRVLYFLIAVNYLLGGLADGNRVELIAAVLYSLLATSE